MDSRSSHGLLLAFVKPTVDENDWSSETHTSCIPNDVQRRILEGIWTRMDLRSAGSSLDNIRCRGL